MSLFNINEAKFPAPALIAFLFIVISACGTSQRATKSDSNGGNVSEIDKAEPPPTPPTSEIKAGKLIEKGKASWYGPNFHGNLTANGETYDMDGMTAAHRTLPFNTLVLVKNKDSGKSAVVRINDRGPFRKNRIIDLSRKAARQIGMIGPGTANVELFVAKHALNEPDTTYLDTPTYTIQLGSFSSQAAAYHKSDQVQGSRVEIIRKNNRFIYRVYYGLYINRDEALEKMDEFEHQNIDGYVKQLENS